MNRTLLDRRHRFTLNTNIDLSDAAFEEHADVGRFGQDVFRWHATQKHGCVDVEALGFPRRWPSDLGPII